jgi:hypothetical protein
MTFSYPHQMALITVAVTIYVLLVHYDTYDPSSSERGIRYVFMLIFGAVLSLIVIGLVSLGAIVVTGLLSGAAGDLYAEPPFTDSVLKFPILIKLAESYAVPRRYKEGMRWLARSRPAVNLIIVALLYYAVMAIVWLVAIFFGMPLEIAYPGTTLFWVPRLFPSDLINVPVCIAIVLVVVRITRNSSERTQQKFDVAPNKPTTPHIESNRRSIFASIKKYAIEIRDMIVALLLIAFGLLFLKNAGGSVVEGITRANWPTTTGTIVSAKLEEGIYPESMHVRLSYKYFVNDNKKYVGKYIHTQEEELFGVKQAEEIVRTKYAMGRQVRVYYDPNHPEIAFLEPGPQLVEIFMLFLGLSLFIPGAIVLYWTIIDPIVEAKGVRQRTRQTPKTSGEFIRLALDLEARDPRKAVELYHQAEKRNTEFSMLIFITSIAAPTLATILAFSASGISGWYGTLLRGAILLGLGFGPPVVLRAQRDYDNNVVSMFRGLGEGPSLLKQGVLGGIFFMIEQILIGLTAAMVLFFSIAPLVSMLLLCDHFDYCGGLESPFAAEVFSSVVSCLALLIVLADIWYEDIWPPDFGIRILFAGIRDNFREVLDYASSLIVVYIFVGIESDVSKTFPSTLSEAALAGTLSGFFLALALSHGSLSTQRKALILLGLSRCQIRLRQWGSARIAVRRISQSEHMCEFLDREDSRALCSYLTNHLIYLTDWIRSGVRLWSPYLYRSKDLQKYIAEAENVLEPDLAYREIWTKSIAAHRLLLQDPKVQNALERGTKRLHFIERFNIIGQGQRLYALYWIAGIFCFVLWVILAVHIQVVW